MAVSVSQLFAPTVATTGAATLYTAPSVPTTSTLSRGRIRFTNTSSGSVSVTAYAIQAAGTASPTNCFMNQVSIAQNTHLDVDVPVLGPGGFIQVLASALTSITVTQLDGLIFS